MLVQALAALTWIFPNLGPTWPREAETYCASINARVPFARELVSAAQQGASNGGIPRLEDDQIYLVGDRQRSSQEHFYFGAALTGSDPRGPVRTAAGFGPLRPFFYCVQGAASRLVRADQALYSLYRKINAENPRRRAELLTDVEYLLNRIGSYGARESYRETYTSAGPALASLDRNGYPVDPDTRAMIPR